MRHNPLALAGTAIGFTCLAFVACAPANHGSARPGTVNKTGPTVALTAAKNANNPKAQKGITNCQTGTPPNASTVETLNNQIVQMQKLGNPTTLEQLPAGSYVLTNMAVSYAAPQDNPTYMTLQVDGVAITGAGTTNSRVAKPSALATCGENFMAGMTAAAPATTGGLQPAANLVQGQQQTQITPDNGKRMTVETKFTVGGTDGKSVVEKSPIATIDISNVIGNGQNPSTNLMTPSSPTGIVSLAQNGTFNSANSGYAIYQTNGTQNQNEIFFSLTPAKDQLFAYFEFYDSQVNAIRRYFLTYSINGGGSVTPNPTPTPTPAPAPTPIPSPVASPAASK